MSKNKRSSDSGVIILYFYFTDSTRPGTPKAMAQVTSRWRRRGGQGTVHLHPRGAPDPDSEGAPLLKVSILPGSPRRRGLWYLRVPQGNPTNASEIICSLISFPALRLR